MVTTSSSIPPTSPSNTIDALDDLDGLGERIAEQAAHLDAATHRLLTDLRAFYDSGAWAKQGARTCGAWLSWRVGWDLRTANEHVRVATRLGKLPLIDDELRRGKMSYAKVRAMVRVATPENEAMLLEEARYSTGAQLEKICRGYAGVRRHDHRPSQRDDGQRRHVRCREMVDGMIKIEAVLHPEEAALVWAALERVASERCREREAALREAARTGPAEPVSANMSEAPDAGAPCPAGTRLGSAEPTMSGAPNTAPPAADHSNGPVEPVMSSNHTSPEASAASADASGSVATPPRAYPSGFDRADALITIAEQALRGKSPDRAPVDLVLTASVEALARPRASMDGATLGNDVHDRPVDPIHTGFVYLAELFDELPLDPNELATLGDGTCVSPTAARRLACDCGLTPVLAGDHGSPISIGRKRRTIPSSMKRALLRRDRTCRFPGCNARVFLQGHHVEHWIDGGKTELANLVSLCGHHHRFVHEYGFHVELSCRDEVRFLDGRGRLLVNVPRPGDYGELGWPTILAANANLAITHQTSACGWTGDRVDYHRCVGALIAADEGRARRPL